MSTLPRDRHDLEVRARAAQLGGAADAARADARSRRQGVEVGSAAEHILDGRTRGRPQQLQAVGELAGEVLGGVHREIDLAGEQRVLDRVDPARLVAGPRAGAIAAGGESHDLGALALTTHEQVRDEPGLRERERAGAGADAQRAHRP